MSAYDPKRTLGMRWVTDVAFDLSKRLFKPFSLSAMFTKAGQVVARLAEAQGRHQVGRRP